MKTEQGGEMGIETVQITFYLCPTCRKQRDSEASAMKCCLCSSCGDVTGEFRGMYCARTCNNCHKRDEVREATNKVIRTTNAIKSLQARLIDTEKDLVRAKNELASAKSLPTNRDATIKRTGT